MEDRRLWILALASGTASSLAIATATIFPIYVFKGNVEGYVGLHSYNLTVFGKEYYSMSLDAVKLFSIPLILQAALNVFALILCYAKTVSGESESVWRKIAYGMMLSTFIWLGILYGCTHIVLEETKTLLADFSHETSAGKIVFEKTLAHPLPAHFITVYFIPIASSILYAITLSLACEQK